MHTTLQTPLNGGLPTKRPPPPLTIAINTSTTLRGVCFLMALSSLLSLAISVAKKQQPLWPLMNISQYAAPYPSIYFFRTGTSLSGFLLVLCSISFWQHRKNPASASIGLGPMTIVGFFLSGLGLVGAGLISCFENNDVHTTLAMLMFVSEASIQFGNVFCHRYPEAASTGWTASRLCRAFGTVYLIGCLFTTVLMASHAVAKVDYVISILEWTATGEILMWCWWYARQIDRVCDNNNKTRRSSSGDVDNQNNIDSNRTTYSFDDQVDEL
jgi:hypothetical protein